MSNIEPIPFKMGLHSAVISLEDTFFPIFPLGTPPPPKRLKKLNKFPNCTILCRISGHTSHIHILKRVPKASRDPAARPSSISNRYLKHRQTYQASEVSQSTNHADLLEKSVPSSGLSSPSFLDPHLCKSLEQQHH